ncbi:MAG: biopolymer transporter ExbD [Bacteroidales bacterium]|nr:biopolymer transporter ExbD [Bacteroidales bacterium]MBQ5532064.1 biopolymer transporter ExbD [Bacteroidales bacterium]MBR4339629.1 biopolymer transporter ExbD [Bacteroidales bacterium]MCR5190564.1 biopolymer transporter ExbD [Bacteroidales bacterium]
MSIIKVRPKTKVEMNLSTQADLVFLLLIFFMITSTFVSPNAIKLLLPQSSSKTMAKQNFEVYIDENKEYAIKQGKDLMSVEESLLESAIVENLSLLDDDATVVIRADQSVPVQNIVYVIDAVNKANDLYGKKCKAILATQAKP